MSDTLILEQYSMFNRGSNPSLWLDNPPSLNELRNNLLKQQDDIINEARERLDENSDEPLLHMTTIGEAILFQISHEAIHAGVISSMRRCLASQKGGRI